ncbi:hypothetical protein T439DRAFT_350358 [Meredithblackwellia eburnea MCA 4105]
MFSFMLERKVISIQLSTSKACTGLTESGGWIRAVGGYTHNNQGFTTVPAFLLFLFWLTRGISSPPIHLFVFLPLVVSSSTRPNEGEKWTQLDTPLATGQARECWLALVCLRDGTTVFELLAWWDNKPGQTKAESDSRRPFVEPRKLEPKRL